MILIEHNHSKCNGDIIITGADGNIVLEAPTMKCCHCEDMFVVIKGSKRKRGFCMKCMSPTCGKEQCDICTPLEVTLGYDKPSSRYCDA